MIVSERSGNMSIKTEALRTGAKKHQCICQDDSGYYGVEFVCHPCPSGLERWLPTYSDKRRFKTDQEAADSFKEAMEWVGNKEGSRVTLGAIPVLKKPYI